MNRKLVIAATPPFAQGAPQETPVEKNGREVMEKIKTDKTQWQAYCNLIKWDDQLRKNAARAEDLQDKMAAEARKLPPDYKGWMRWANKYDEKSPQGKRLAAMIAAFDAQCR